MILILCCLTRISLAQDLIYKKDKSVLMVKIISINAENITYRDFNNPNGPTLNIFKSEVIKVKTESGKEIMMDGGNSSSGKMGSGGKHAIKIDVFSMAYSKFVIGYEQSIKPTMTWELQLGQIGVGSKDEDITKLSGTFLRFGIKYKRSPEYYSLRSKSSPLLKGAYIKPELVLGKFTEERKEYDWYSSPWYDPYTYTKRDISFICLMFNVGKQWTIDDYIAIDYYIGAGPGIASLDKTYKKGYDYAVFGIGNFYLQTGLKLGIIF